MTSWRDYKPGRERHTLKEPADLTARQKAVEDSLRPEVREEIHEAARAYAVARMARFEMERGRK